MCRMVGSTLRYSRSFEVVVFGFWFSGIMAGRLDRAGGVCGMSNFRYRKDDRDMIVNDDMFKNNRLIECHVSM